MRYSGSEKLEIIKLVEQSTLSVCRTLASIGIPRSTFYDWYSRYQDGGIEALEDGRPRPRRVWNKIPDEIGTAIVNRPSRSRTCRYKPDEPDAFLNRRPNRPKCSDDVQLRRDPRS